MADSNPPEQKSLRNRSRQSLSGPEGEEGLIRALQAGDREALELIFERYHRLVLVTAIRILHDVGEAEDLMQSIFLEIFQKANQFDPSKGTLRHWILQYAYHRSINRKNHLSLRHSDGAVDFLDSRAEETWITKVSPLAQGAVWPFREVLAELNCQQREVMERVFFGEMSLKEIAEETNQDLGAVRNHYYRGLKKLRSLLSKNANRDKKAALDKQLGRANA
jgi:RNA polymerase sigma-70 factor, ECF subfamily